MVYVHRSTRADCCTRTLLEASQSVSLRSSHPNRCCVSVLAADHVAQPFEPFLDWNDFGVWIAEADLPDVEAILRGFTVQQKAAKMVGLTGCELVHGLGMNPTQARHPGACK